MVKAQPTSSSSAMDPVRQVIRNGSTTTKEQVEIQMYLSKLKELVPHMPKNRKVSKLEVIQHVIDYICDLQTALEQNHPANRRRNRSLSDAAAAATILAASSSTHRQPLGLLASIPNNTSTEVDSASLLFIWSMTKIKTHLTRFLSVSSSRWITLQGIRTVTSSFLVRIPSTTQQFFFDHHSATLVLHS